MSARSLLTLSLLSALGTAAAAPAPASPTRASALTIDQRASFELAVQSFRTQRYSAAYGRFLRLADAGHAPSAQIALMMYRNGSVLFGTAWDATPEQIQRWSFITVEAERPAAGLERDGPAT